MSKIHKGDQVIVNTGKDKGKRGTVLRTLDSGHVVVEGINVAKKHAKPNPMKGITGGIVSKEMPIDISNVALFNPATQRRTAWVLKCWMTAVRFVFTNLMANQWTHRINYGAFKTIL